MQDFEKLGLFYLGREYDLPSGTRLETPVLYDSRDLVTHAVCVGMTGSGKTGLCLSLIEEAAIDGVPVIAIDPKGDLGNLLLTFPGLTAADFAPWIDADEARRAGSTPAAYAAAQAEAWRTGLADWGQDGARIERLRASADFAIYTPGSSAGLPVSVLSSFAAPDASLREDAELLAERAGGTSTSLLSLAGVNAEPRSREHTLIASLLSAAWKDGRDLDLAALIQQIQTPPFTRMGVLDLESFFPQKDRFELAMRFNAILAAPGFEQWFDGTPLDPATLLYGADGRPRVAIMSIAHLGDTERMFFVSLLLNQMVAWMRAQSGTSSLRAILYMDEIAGYFPPVANPPSKPPLLTLLKQARAFGLGVVLSTQNPVDLDYKGLANTGTWFLGRLQTERDKERVLDGLQGAAAGGLDRAEADRILSALGKRTFLLHDVHEKRPVVFQTRWTLSYLRGPLSRDQIRALTAEHGERPAGAATREAEVRGLPADVLPAKAGSYGEARGKAGSDAAPVVPPGIQQVFVPGGGDAPVYAPVVVGAARVAFTDTKLGIDTVRDVVYAVPVAGGAVAVDWARGSRLEIAPEALEQQAAGGASYLPVPAPALQPKNFAVWQKALAQYLAQAEKIELFRHAATTLTSTPGESEREFRIRLKDAVRSARDEALDAVRHKYAAQQSALADRLRRAQAVVEREAEQASQQKLQTAVSFGATLLGAFFGRRSVSASTLGRATTAVRGVGRSMKETSDVRRASEGVEAVQEQMKQLEDDIRQETQALAAGFDAVPELDRVTLAPRRGQVTVQFVALGWDPR